MKKKIAALTATLILVAAGSISASSVAAAGDFQLESTIALGSTRDNPAGDPFLTAEIYLINPDGTNPRRLTNNAYGDTFPTLSPDGKKIVFDTNWLTVGSLCDGTPRLNVSDLFVMDTDSTEQALLSRGSSATWSPDGMNIAFHASASYYASGGLVTGCPIRTDPGSATTDSDIFVANVDDLLAGVEQPVNITNSWTVSAETGQRLKIADDPDWSPDGQRIVFTAHDVGDEGPNYPDRPFISDSAEIYVMNPNGTGLQQLTSNNTEERGPSWSPDGTRIVFICRIGDGTGGAAFEICVMNADGTGLVQLTDNSTFEGTPTFSPDGQRIVFSRLNQLFTMNAVLNPDGTLPTATPLTFPPGINLLANWGELRVKV
jgi:TolB protein